MQNKNLTYSYTYKRDRTNVKRGIFKRAASDNDNQKTGSTCHYSRGEVEEVEVGCDDTEDETSGTDDGPDDGDNAAAIAIGQCAS